MKNKILMALLLAGIFWCPRYAEAGVCITDSFGNCIDRSAPFPTPGPANLAVSQATIGVSAGLLVAARLGNIGTGRVQLWISNGGAAAIYCGPTNGVLTTTGAMIPAGAVSPMLAYTGAVYCISGSGGNAVSAWETY